MKVMVLTKLIRTGCVASDTDGLIFCELPTSEPFTSTFAAEKVTITGNQVLVPAECDENVQGEDNMFCVRPDYEPWMWGKFGPPPETILVPGKKIRVLEKGEL